MNTCENLFTRENAEGYGFKREWSTCFRSPALQFTANVIKTSFSACFFAIKTVATISGIALPIILTAGALAFSNPFTAATSAVLVYHSTTYLESALITALYYTKLSLVGIVSGSMAYHLICGTNPG